MAKVYSMHMIALKRGTNPEGFERFWRDDPGSYSEDRDRIPPASPAFRRRCSSITRVLYLCDGCHYSLDLQGDV